MCIWRSSTWKSFQKVCFQSFEKGFSFNSFLLEWKYSLIQKHCLHTIMIWYDTKTFIKFYEDIFLYLRYYLRTLTKDGLPNFSFERASRLQNILNGLHLYCQVYKYLRKSIWYNFCDMFRLLGLALAELRCQNCSKLTKNSTNSSKVYFEGVLQS